MRGVLNDVSATFFLVFFTKAYVTGTHLNFLDAIQMRTHNICFYKEVDASTWAVSEHHKLD